MGGLRTFVVNLVLVALFAVLVVYFALGFIANNNPNSQILVQNHMNGTLANLNRSLSDFSSTASDIYNPASTTAKSIDGTLSARGYPDIYCSSSFPSFWQLDLGQEYSIDRIEFYNRADCCGDRAQKMTMSLLDNNQAVVATINTFTDFIYLISRIRTKPTFRRWTK